MKEISFGDAISVEDAVKHLGEKHCNWLYSLQDEEYQIEIQKRIMGAWLQNKASSHSAYVSIVNKNDLRKILRKNNGNN